MSANCLASTRLFSSR